MTIGLRRAGGRFLSDDVILYAGRNAGDDVMGNLHDMSLVDACRRFHARVARYLADKRERVSQGTFDDLDHFPCWYCVKYLGKVNTSDSFPAAAWLPGN